MPYINGSDFRIDSSLNTNVSSDDKSSDTVIQLAPDLYYPDTPIVPSIIEQILL